MTGKTIGLAFAFAAIAVLYFVESANAIDTSGGPGAIAVDPTQVARLSQAIAYAEGFNDPNDPNSRPTRNNNPGDLRGWGTYPVDSGGFSIFPDASSGWAALQSEVTKALAGTSSNYSPYMTIRQMAQIYSPAGWPAWAANVANFLGVSEDSLISQV